MKKDFWIAIAAAFALVALFWFIDFTVTRSYAAPRLGDTTAVLSNLNGSPQYNQSVTTDGLSSFWTTALSGGEILLIQCNGDTYIKPTTTDSTTVDTTDGLLIPSNLHFYMTLKPSEKYVAFFSDGFAVTCKVFKME